MIFRKLEIPNLSQVIDDFVKKYQLKVRTKELTQSDTEKSQSFKEFL